jgi:hypothetical protein
MIRNLIILTIVLAFVFTGTASAIKRVPASDDNQGVIQQKPNRAGDSESRKAPPKARQSSVDDGEKGTRDGRENIPAREPKKSSGDERDGKDRVKDRDRFIDENDDGINDRIKKPPEKIKRKKETENPPRDKREGPAREKRETPSRDRRSR